MSSDSAGSTERDLILGRLRKVQPAAISSPDVSAFYAQLPVVGQETLVERLVLNLGNAMARVIRTNRVDLPAALAAVVHDQTLTSIALGPEILAQPDLCQALEAVCELVPVTTAHAQTQRLFDDVAAGITLSRAAIAETGTVVLWTGPSSPRLLSLVPPVHIVIVDAGTIFHTLFDLMQQANWSAGLPTNVVLVSSPSKTADIQQTLAYGAHGPKALIVMLVEDVS